LVRAGLPAATHQKVGAFLTEKKEKVGIFFYKKVGIVGII